MNTKRTYRLPSGTKEKKTTFRPNCMHIRMTSKSIHMVN